LRTVQNRPWKELEDTRFAFDKAIWKNGATPKSKLFLWLAAQHRIWTSSSPRSTDPDFLDSTFVCRRKILRSIF
jgi:hypothetical protein